MKCFYCKKEITWKKNKNCKSDTARYKMVALEIPYKNLFFHKECLSEIDDLLLYLTNNLELVYNYNV